MRGRRDGPARHEPFKFGRRVTPDAQGGEAVAMCREGDTEASILTLERLLKDADMPCRGVLELG